MNMLPSSGTAALQIAGAVIPVVGDLAANRSTIGFRPEALSVGTGPIPARIRAVEDLGPEVFVHVLVDHESEELRLVAKASPPFAGAIDDNVSLELKGSVHVFGEEGERIATVLAHQAGMNIELAEGSGSV
jgi:multiple sugar transport system ATP-binding protein